MVIEVDHQCSHGAGNIQALGRLSWVCSLCQANGDDTNPSDGEKITMVASRAAASRTKVLRPHKRGAPDFHF